MINRLRKLLTLHVVFTFVQIRFHCNTAQLQPVKKKKNQEGGWKKSLVGVAHSIICVSNRLLTAALGSTKPWDSILFTAIGLRESMTT